MTNSNNLRFGASRIIKHRKRASGAEVFLAEMSPTMWAVILTHDDGTIQDRQCFSTTVEESLEEARKLYNDWKDALVCRREIDVVA